MAARPLVLLGPTASGKSDVAMAMAAASNDIEIVAVDSMQVYREMDIGTAKPSAEDRRRVPHHCLDLADPADEFTVTQFAESAAAALSDIEGRQRGPLLVAGTGLYLRAITDPMDIPGQWPAVRSALEDRLATDGCPALHAELSAADPLGASRIDPANARRVVRALEVTIGSGRPFSSFGPGIAVHGPTRFDQVGLRWSRPALAARIEWRVGTMIDAGLVGEVERLASRRAGWSRTARQALGYKELLDHVDGRCSLDEAVSATITRTRQFAVRQERWFRRDPRVRWVDVHDDPVAEVLAVLGERPADAARR